MNSEAISLLVELGFSANEAKTYTQLLTCQPASAYEIARLAAIPTSKIYETVNKLVTKGVILPIDEGAQTATYVALPSEELLRQLNSATELRTNKLGPLLLNPAPSATADMVWPLSDAADVVNKTREVLLAAENSVLISLWPEELDWLVDDLRALEDRGVNIAMVHFGIPDRLIGATYHHPALRTLYEEKGGRGLTVVCDGQVVVIANYLQDGTVEGAWSRSRAFVTVAEDYVKHDVYITKVTRFLDREVRARFGDGYEHLRNIFDAEA